MAEFTVTLGGQEYLINGPEGATQIQAESFARQSMMPGRQPDTPGLPPMRFDFEGEQGRSKRATAQLARETGYPEALAVSSGRTASQLGTGTEQILNMVRRDVPAQRQLAQEQATNKAIYGGLQRELPITTGIGEALPYLAVPASAGVLGGAGIVGGLEAMQYGTPSERGMHGVAGAGSMAVGGALGRMFGRVLAPGVPGYINETRRGALESARNIGYQPRYSEITGSPLAARVEDVSARIPGGAGVMQGQQISNQRAINRAAAASIGETAEEVGAPVLSAAATRIGKAFEDIKALGQVTVGGKTVMPILISKNVGTVADDILRQQSKMIQSQRDENLITLAQQAKMAANTNMRIDGETYQLTRSGLSQASFDATGTNRTLYGKLLSALDDSAEVSLRQAGRNDLADALKTARPQYSNLKILERGVTAEGGNVSPARVASNLRTQNPAAFREGRMAGNPLYDIAQIGENLKPLQQGSQTYERSMIGPSLLLTSPLAYAGARATTSPLINRYAEFAAASPTMGRLSQGSVPLVRAGVMGLLQAPGGVFNPVMPKY